MIGVLPNPKRSFQIEKPVAEVKTALEHLPLYTTKYKLYKANPTLNQFTFEASEFLSLGVYIDINYFLVNDIRTEVVIEIRRKIGSFDQSHEVSLANTHIETITDLISTSLNSDHSIKLGEMQQQADEQQQKADDRQQKIEEAKIKVQEEKENNPALYYVKQGLLWLLSAGLFGGTIYMIYWFFVKQ
jgi:hypothetical protein